MARKQTPLEPIHADPRFAPAQAILRTLEDGAAAIEREIDALRIEEQLTRRPNDPRASSLEARLKGHRAAAPKPPPAPASDLPAEVTAALDLLRAGERPQRPHHLDRKAAIAQLEADRELVHAAILGQRPILDAIRDELSADLAKRLVPAHRELILAQFRAAQALAAATDSEREFRRAVTAAGYTWRPDWMPSPAWRSALILGSEADFDSEVSRMRRMLEGLKVI
jgi:hypothetical protein